MRDYDLLHGHRHIKIKPVENTFQAKIDFTDIVNIKNLF